MVQTYIAYWVQKNESLEVGMKDKILGRKTIFELKINFLERKLAFLYFPFNNFCESFTHRNRFCALH